jgi:hypothetical protein
MMSEPTNLSSRLPQARAEETRGGHSHCTCGYVRVKVPRLQGEIKGRFGGASEY